MFAGEDQVLLGPPEIEVRVAKRVNIARATQPLTGGNLTEETRSTIKSRIVERKAPAEDPWDNTQLPTVAGLILGSPEFQRQ